MYFPNVYGLFTVFSFSCELQNNESGLSLEQIIGQGNFRFIENNMFVPYTIQAVELLFQQIQHLEDLKYLKSIEIL